MLWTRRSATRSHRDSESSGIDAMAEFCADVVWTQLSAKAAHMSPAELRGYARARALAAVRAHVERANTTPSEPSTLPAAAVAELVERTVHLVMRRQIVDRHVPRGGRAAA